MAVKYDRADKARVMQIKAALIEALRPFKHNTEALLVAIAAGQVARTFLEKYPPNVMREQVELVFIPFLRQETVDEGNIIKTPFDVFKSLGSGKRRKH